MKFLKDRKKFVEALKKLEPKKISFEVKRFKLIKSTLTKEGPAYEEIGF